MNGKPKIKVLLADDTLIAREGWRRIIETVSDIIVVGEATTAEETPNRVSEYLPDIVLMDLKWYGDETAGSITIRKLKFLHPDVKIIAVTAYENLIGDARRAGADEALTKTFTKEQLLSVIRELMSAKVISTHALPEITGSLTDRELDVMRLVEKGYTDKQIASALNIAESTVKNHVRVILSKLGATNRTQAAKIARETGRL